MFKKKFMAIAIALVLAFSLVACGDGNDTSPNSGNVDEGGTNDGDTIVIGGIGPITGDLSVYGEPTLDAVALYFEENDEVLGKKIKFIKQDDKGDPTDAANAFSRLYEQNGAVGIIGAVTSKPSSAVAAEAINVGIPVITPTGTSPDITEYGDNIFRACFLDEYQSNTLAQYAIDADFKTVAIMYDKGDDYSSGLAEKFEEVFAKKGGSTIETATFASGDKDFKAQLTKISEKNPDILFIPAYYSDIALIAKQAKEVGITAQLLGADGWDGVLDVIADVKDVEGAIFTNHFFTSDPDEKVQNFVKKYNDKYGKDPNAFAALGYDAAAIMYKAIEDAGSTDPEEITAAIQNISISGITSKNNITFDENGNPLKDISIARIEDGKNVFFAGSTSDSH